MTYRALTIAGSDSGGGAGIQADLKTFFAFGVHGMSAVTAVTAQNSLGVQAVSELPLPVIAAQIESVAGDVGADAVKTGMLAGAGVVELVAEIVERLDLGPLVVDPVVTSGSGTTLLPGEAIRLVMERLLPLAEGVTPNLAEAEALAGRPVKTLAGMKEAAAAIGASGCRWVVVKGGHLEAAEEAVDVVFDGKKVVELRAPLCRIGSPHGTGCTFSAAVAAGLASGREPLQAIKKAKEFITRAIQVSYRPGRGQWVTNQNVDISSPWS